MSANVWETFDVIARWVHVIAGIMWVGNSMLFNWLDRTLVPGSREGIYGQSWLLHSGAFYFVEKTALVNQPLPEPLHWFKWQAYITWLSGVALLIVVYYAGGRAVMADAEVAALSHGTAVALGAGSIVGGWALYELVQRTLAPRAPVATTVLLALLFLGVVFLLTGFLNGRAAFLHIGALLATIMAGNVAMTIVPSQRELVKSVASGGRADAAISARAKRVSIHNNYFTFPVIVLMVAGHFPALYAHRWNWLVLLLLITIGATVRHLLNIRFTFRAWVPALGATIATATVALFLLLSVSARPNEDSAAQLASIPATVSFAQAKEVIDRRCAACHAASPSDLSFGVAPGGVMFDSPAQIAAHLPRIRERAVVTRTMPPGNKTRMTDRERAMLGRWIEQGGAIR